MKFIEGYLADDLEKLPAEVLEDIILRIRHDYFLSEAARRELMESYLEARHRVLCDEFAYTEKNVKRIEEMNNLLTRQTLEVAQLGWNIYQENLELKRSNPKAYKPVSIEMKLSVPGDLYYREEAEKLVYTGKEEDLWEILMRHNPKMRTFDILPCTPLSTESKQETRSLEELQQYLLWGGTPEEDPERRSWGHVMTGLDYEKTKHICFVWPFHNLLDFCGLSMQDILKIDKFNMNISLEYDRI